MAQEANSWDPSSILGRDTSFDVPESSCLLSGPGLQPEFRYTHCLSQAFFSFGDKSYQEKGTSRGLIDRSTDAWGFDASNPSWVNIAKCIDESLPHPFFYYSTTP